MDLQTLYFSPQIYMVDPYDPYYSSISLQSLFDEDDILDSSLKAFESVYSALTDAEPSALVSALEKIMEIFPKLGPLGKVLSLF